MTGDGRTLEGKTLFITGASRGIGHAIGLRAARDGANIVIAAKTDAPNPRLPGTIHSAARDMERAGGRALALRCDIRDEDQVLAAVAAAAERFGGIDILVNNASAIGLTPVSETSMKRYDLMNQINARGTFLCSQACIPHLKKAANPHILIMAPPISLAPRWYEGHLAYSIAKFGMSMCVIGLAAECADAGIAVNALWPQGPVDTVALRMTEGRFRPEDCPGPEMMADAAHAVLTTPAGVRSGQFLIDEQVLRDAGVTDFHRYGGDPARWPKSDLLPRKASL